MSKHTHTPGPWSLSGPYHPHGSAFPVLYVDGTIHGAVASVHMHHEWGEANARLISAAPDLLAALEMVRDADDDNKLDGNEGIPGIARAKINAAISKAKGEA